ncbi:hypothetical protein [Lysobacter sp. N42]|nr:hypothetical protein [Lysobacter sp. N42]
MDTFELDDLAIAIAPTGASDAVAGPPCIAVFIILMTIPAN